MKSLGLYIQDINESLLFESFKSSKLRELISIMKDFAKDYVSSNKSTYNTYTMRFLPRGVAWDKITDSEVFVGESGDKGFMKKYINDNYICIWYPMGVQDKSTSYGSLRVSINSCYLSCGDKFIIFPSSTISCVKSGKINMEEEVDGMSNLDGIIDVISGKTLKDNNMRVRNTTEFCYYNYGAKPKGSYSPRSFTVDDLVKGNILAYCLVISKDSIAKYSTLNLIISRIKSRFGGIYMGDKEWERRYAYLQSSKRLKKLEDMKAVNLPPAEDIKAEVQQVIDRIKMVTRKITLAAMEDLLDKYDGMDTGDFADVFLSGSSMNIAYHLVDNQQYILAKKTLGNHLQTLKSLLDQINIEINSTLLQEVMDNITAANKYMDTIE